MARVNDADNHPAGGGVGGGRGHPTPPPRHQGPLHPENSFYIPPPLHPDQQELERGMEIEREEGGREEGGREGAESRYMCCCNVWLVHDGQGSVM